MKKNLFIALALATSVAGVSMAETAPQATEPQAPAATVKDPALADGQQVAAPEATAPVPGSEVAPEQTPGRKAVGVFADVNVGTMGVGMNVGYEFNKYLKIRLRGSYLGASYKDTWNDDSTKINSFPIDGKFDFDGSSIGLMLDYHPFGGCFHLTGGLNFSGMKMDAKATMTDSGNLMGGLVGREYDFGGYTYKVANAGEDAQVKGRYEWNRVQPYLGIGWSSDGSGTRRFYFSFDMGVNFIGKGQLSVSHSGADLVYKKTGTSDPFQAATNIDALLEESLREEGKDFFDIADKIIVYPVIQFGVGYRF